jgi:hypothetical protein
VSDSLRIALVGEGITDFEIVRAAIDSMIEGRSFDLKLLQPEGSITFTGVGQAGPFGGGWKGVYEWCRQAVARGDGSLSGDPLFISYDLLVIHIDADVASEDPANDSVDPIAELAGQLPCVQACPPPGTTTDAIRLVLLSWVGEEHRPGRMVFCTPSKSTEAWVMAAFFPTDKEMRRNGWECHPDPASRLAQQPKGRRFRKSHADYEKRAPQFRIAWPKIVAELSEAARFQNEFLDAAQLIG